MLSGKIQRTRCDSTAGNVSVPATIYNIGPSRHPQPRTREQLLAETLRQLSGSRWELTAGNAIAAILLANAVALGGVWTFLARPRGRPVLFDSLN